MLKDFFSAHKQENLQRLFWIAVIVTLLIKIVLSSLIPITADEAYFVLWGRYPDIGFYDHPPMIGWILYLVQLLGSSALVVRLPAVLFSTWIGIGIYFFLKQFNKQTAMLVALCFICSPFNVFYILITTDAPLLLFSFLSGITLWYAVKKENNWLYMLSGVYLGLAFLSKYFAVLLGLGFLAYFIFSSKTNKKAAGSVILFLSVVPFALLNLYYNYTHEWNNIMFNVFNRNDAVSLNILNPLIFIVSQLCFITPFIAYYLVKNFKSEKFVKIFKNDLALFAFSFFVPIAVFFLISFKRSVGLHWTISFYPFMFVLLIALLPVKELKKSLKYIIYFSLALLLIAAAAFSFQAPLLSKLENNANYEVTVMSLWHKEFIKSLQVFEKDFIFATGSYADSSILEFYFKKPVIVFGMGSKHARQHDILSDFRKYDGKNMLIICKSVPEGYNKFFNNVIIEQKVIKDAVFYFVKGYGFKYEEYKKDVLARIKEQFYNVPPYIKMRGDENNFLEKYFG